MPNDDSSPIPIYFLSLMLLKSPTRSANREGAQCSGGEGDGGMRGPGARPTWHWQHDGGPETWDQVLSCSTCPGESMNLSLPMGHWVPALLALPTSRN
jgi:hypothetical protein